MFDGPPHEFSFYRDNIKHCESGNKKKYVVGWPIVSRLWPVKTCIILSKEEVLIFKDTRFQLQQKEALSLYVSKAINNCNTTNISMCYRIWMPT